MPEECGLCILAICLKPKGGQVRREAGLMEMLFPVGGRSGGICCAMLSYWAFSLFCWWHPNTMLYQLFPALHRHHPLSCDLGSPLGQMQGIGWCSFFLRLQDMITSRKTRRQEGQQRYVSCLFLSLILAVIYAFTFVLLWYCLKLHGLLQVLTN